jgi:molybdopterin synthase sulfur carrier subunit
MAILLMFAAARQAAGRSHDTIHGDTLADVIETACTSYGPAFRDVLSFSRVWINGAQPPDDPARLHVLDTDEIAILPPISGG